MTPCRPSLCTSPKSCRLTPELLLDLFLDMVPAVVPALSTHQAAVRRCSPQGPAPCATLTKSPSFSWPPLPYQARRVIVGHSRGYLSVSLESGWIIAISLSFGACRTNPRLGSVNNGTTYTGSSYSHLCPPVLGSRRCLHLEHMTMTLFGKGVFAEMIPLPTCP